MVCVCSGLTHSIFIHYVLLEFPGGDSLYVLLQVQFKMEDPEYLKYLLYVIQVILFLQALQD